MQSKGSTVPASFTAQRHIWRGKNHSELCQKNDSRIKIEIVERNVKIISFAYETL